jgi:trehalose 6-phosphate phosphatase
VFLDFDGSLSPIVARPELAAPAPGAREAVAALVGVYSVVAVVSGRRTEDVRDLLRVEGVRYEGLYGIGDEPVGASSPHRDVEDAVAGVSGAWVEEKGSATSVHYRQSPDPPAARAQLLERLRPIAERSGFRLIEGKMTVELLPAGVALKGGVVERLVTDHGLRAALYAGDDVADLEAFDVLERARAHGVETVRVAVRGAETPAVLLDVADEIVEGPQGLVALLEELVP